MDWELRSVKQRAPWVMAGARAALGPELVIAARAGWSSLILASTVVIALLSDIFDGILARRWKCDTAAVRLFDSMADIVFYLGCAIALWIRQPQLTRDFAAPIVVVLGLEALKLAFDFAKFGKPTSYHTYLAKAWGLVLATTVIMSFTMQPSPALRIAWWTALVLGVLYCLEGLVISLFMPEWRHDLKTLRRALRVRRQILAERDAARFAQWIGSLIAIMLLLISNAAYASSIPSVTFIGGSTPGITSGAVGTIDTGSDLISFQWNGGSLSIPYAQIQNFSYREKPVNLGVLPFIAVVLVRPQPRRHIMTITYLDTSGQKQVAIFEVPKQGSDILPVVLQERSGVCADQYQLPCRPASMRNSQKTSMLRGPLFP